MQIGPTLFCIHNKMRMVCQHKYARIHHFSPYTHRYHICPSVHPVNRDNRFSYHKPLNLVCTCHRHNRIPFLDYNCELVLLYFDVEQNYYCCLWANKTILYLQQFNSSLPSSHSALPEHIKCPGMHVWSLHWNWSGRHVTFWQFGAASSSPFGQSLPPSHSQLLCMQLMRSLHWYSDVRQEDTERMGFVQP